MVKQLKNFKKNFALLLFTLFSKSSVFHFDQCQSVRTLFLKNTLYWKVRWPCISIKIYLFNYLSIFKLSHFEVISVNVFPILISSFSTTLSSSIDEIRNRCKLVKWSNYSSWVMIVVLFLAWKSLTSNVEWSRTLITLWCNSHEFCPYFQMFSSYCFSQTAHIF